MHHLCFRNFCCFLNNFCSSFTEFGNLEEEICKLFAIVKSKSDCLTMFLLISDFNDFREYFPKYELFIQKHSHVCEIFVPVLNAKNNLHARAPIDIFVTFAARVCYDRLKISQNDCEYMNIILHSSC